MQNKEGPYRIHYTIPINILVRLVQLEYMHYYFLMVCIATAIPQESHNHMFV